MAIRTTVGGTGLIRTRKTVTFDGSAGNGAVGTVTLFTTTGQLLVALLVPFCTLVLSGATATLALGVTGSTGLFIAATTATGIGTNQFWTSTTPSSNGVALPTALRDIAITDNIIGTVAVAAISGGTLRFDVYWMPLSATANLT